MFSIADNSVLAAEVTLMQNLANDLLTELSGPQDDFVLCIPDTDTNPVEEIVAVRARNTPGIIRSRRIKGYFIG